jgi:hypothetical protein
MLIFKNYRNEKTLPLIKLKLKKQPNSHLLDKFFDHHYLLLILNNLFFILIYIIFLVHLSFNVFKLLGIFFTFIELEGT